jgi:hypothetical protein
MEWLTYVHQHAIWFVVGLGALAWLVGSNAEGNKDAMWVAIPAGLAAGAVLIWHLADPWIKDEELVKPIGMIETVQARLKLNPKDEAAQQAWSMIREKMSAHDSEMRACMTAKVLLNAQRPTEALRLIEPKIDPSAVVLDLLSEMKDAP